MIFFFLLSLPFPVGEYLEYEGYWGPVRVGTSYIKFDREVFEGRGCYSIESVQKTEGVYSFFFNIEDYYKSVVDTSEFTTINFIKDIQEGEYNKKTVLKFNEDSVYYSDGRRCAKIRGARDIFAAIYWMRMQELNSGDTLEIPFHSSCKNRMMKVPVKGPFEVEVPAGRYSSYLLVPGVGEAEIFGSKKPVQIYLSSDREHVPVKIEGDLNFGRISFRLKELLIKGEV